MEPFVPQNGLTPDQRKGALQVAIRAHVLKGGIVQSQSDFDAVIAYPKRSPGCIVATVLFFVTCHFYLYYWLFTQFSPPKRVMLAVDERGNVLTQKLSR